MLRVHHRKSISPITFMPNARTIDCVKKSFVHVTYSLTASSDSGRRTDGEEGQNQTANEQPLISAQRASANHRWRYGWRHGHCHLSGVFIGSWCSASAQAVNEEVHQRRSCSSEIPDRKCHFKTEPTFNHGSVSMNFAFKTISTMILNFCSSLACLYYN